MKRYITLILALLSLGLHSQDVLLEIEDDRISLEEFKHIFNKNNDNEEIDKEYLDEYIELFVNFKLKVKEAKSLGFDTVKTFIDELEGYRKQLARPYLRDDNFNDELFDEALDRIQYDINADHILNSPDFRSHERSYQMLCQVAGRAGRSDQKGKVMIQTYDPENLTLKQVIENDYEGLFNIEKKERIQYHYPPYYRMIKITFKSRQFDIINKSSNWFLNVLKQSYNGTVLGPTFPEVSRVRNFYNKELLVKVDSNLKPSSLKILLKKIYRSFQSISTFRNVRVNFDVDPY